MAIARGILLIVLCGFCSASGEAQVFVTLYHFGGHDGSRPYGGLIEGSVGTLYGTTLLGGANDDAGLVFRINKDGSGFLKLHDFDRDDPQDGAEPYSPLLEGSDGVLYGSTGTGGDPGYGYGILFRINKDGTEFQNFHDFYYDDGSEPRAGVIEGSDGILYGTTSYGGIHGGHGTVFSVNRDGTDFQKLHDFDGHANGSVPEGPIIEASDGFLYGTTFWGGNLHLLGDGIVFKIAKDGSNFAKLHDFVEDVKDGAHPFAGVIEGSDGRLYGTTSGGGGGLAGIVFSLKKDGSDFRQIHSFHGTDGSAPRAPLTESGEFLYGVTYRGGLYNVGVVFRIRRDGTGYQVIHEFETSADGATPRGGLVVASDGSFYGTAENGGSYGNGTIFKVSVKCEAAIEVPTEAGAGSIVPITIHIGHYRPRTVTVPWELRLIDPGGQMILKRTTEPHTFEPGDVVDRKVQFRVPDDLAAGTYTLELAISGMEGTKGATTTFRVIRPE